MDNGGYQSGIVRILKETFGKCKVRVTRDPLDFHVAVNSRKSDRYWQSVAHSCVERQLDPRCYVEWRFHVEFPGYPVPAKFASAAQLEKYVQEGKPDVRYTQVQGHWRLMTHKLNLLVQHGDDQLQVLLNTIHNFDPIFIYAVASLSGRASDLPANVLAEARSHAMWNPVYKDRFSHLVPAEVFEGGAQ